MKAYIELKPCPFCGKPIKARKGFGGLTFFICGKCGATVSFTGDKVIGPRIREAENPIAEWNKRAE